MHCTRNNRRCTHCGAVVAVRELEAHIAAMKGTAESLAAACASGDLEALAKMFAHGASPLDAVNDVLDSPLHAAARGAQVSAMQLLLEQGGDVNKRNSRGETPLHIAAGLKGAGDQQTQVVMLLLASGCDVSAANVLGDSPMQVAQRSGNHDVTLMLSRSGSMLRPMSRGASFDSSGGGAGGGGIPSAGSFRAR